ncbi:conserved hypothetical protein [Culex quinquefasciatus]|uniref:Uncharacterized protein n=1 Tax=Culex quinquefasciatus TaxID=7176 RepID=B0XI54_CULQU|nr:conserved hypothetical protein [Culex quinquefasciatus]|eukprot:XP_001869326.1 conserved hypothetical protein [Culex quinquefasciatus]
MLSFSLTGVNSTLNDSSSSSSVVAFSSGLLSSVDLTTLGNLKPVPVVELFEPNPKLNGLSAGGVVAAAVFVVVAGVTLSNMSPLAAGFTAVGSFVPTLLILKIGVSLHTEFSLTFSEIQAATTKLSAFTLATYSLSPVCLPAEPAVSSFCGLPTREKTCLLGSVVAKMLAPRADVVAAVPFVGHCEAKTDWFLPQQVSTPVSTNGKTASTGPKQRIKPECNKDGKAGAGRDKSALIQTSGIFSEGLAKRSRYEKMNNSSREPGEAMRRPVLRSEIKVDPEEERKRICDLFGEPDEEEGLLSSEGVKKYDANMPVKLDNLDYKIKPNAAGLLKVEVKVELLKQEPELSTAR